MNRTAFEQDDILRDGDKVKINIVKIMSRQDFESKTQKYKEWLYANSDSVFTVRRVNVAREHSLIELVEDRTTPKWLWWDGDLVRGASNEN